MEKTKMCEYFIDGRCRYGASCAFAHEESEIRAVPDLRKTRLCHAFSQGRCDSKDCNFAHGQEELKTTDFCFKKTLCIWHAKGKCANGDKCRFAHGSEELKEHGGVAQEDRRKRALDRLDRAPQKRQRLGEQICDLCHTSVATHLGVFACPVCRSTSLVPSSWHP